jgi:hypothetical protein
MILTFRQQIHAPMHNQCISYNYYNHHQCIDFTDVSEGIENCIDKNKIQLSVVY